MPKLIVTLLISILLSACAIQQDSGKHLFILSGQSNMEGLNADKYFTPLVGETFDADKVIVVKDAKGGQPIRRWYKNWQPSANNIPKNYQAENNGDLYSRLMSKVLLASNKERIATVTFVWMQGERDAREKNGHLYQQSLLGLIEQIKQDLNIAHINVVIGRLSDFDIQQKRYLHWNKIRSVQVEVAESLPKAAWVNTDDLNDGVNHQGKKIVNDLHYSVAGYKLFGKRLADASAKLIITTP